MPKLDDATRQQVDYSHQRRSEIEAIYKDRQYSYLTCRLCNYACNGLTLHDALAAMKAHEESHPEYAEWASLQLPMRTLVDSLHDHECVMVSCTCICGCDLVGTFCNILGDMCAVCTIRAGRGSRGHGNKDLKEESNALV